jgi:hypothetical protein
MPIGKNGLADKNGQLQILSPSLLILCFGQTYPMNFIRGLFLTANAFFMNGSVYAYGTSASIITKPEQ